MGRKLFLCLAVVLSVNAVVLANYAGRLDSISSNSPIELGQDLEFTSNVTNTGSDDWYWWDYPAWIVRVRSASWSPPWSYMTYYVWQDVDSGASDSYTATLGADNLPSSTGNYSIAIDPGCVDDYGYIYWMSNAPMTLNFTIQAATVRYTLTVNSGSGSGTYEEGEVVPLFADGPQAGFVWDTWAGDTHILDDPSSPVANATMPACNAEVTATYKPAEYCLTVNSGSGSGTYAPGTEVVIQANTPPPDSFFDVWVGDIEPPDYPGAPSTVLTMPNHNAELTATFTTSAVRSDSFSATLSNGVVISGEGSGYGGGQWYEYPLYGWWNQWYYDHPLDWNRSKVVDLHLEVLAAQPGGLMEVAINWATANWGSEVFPPIPGILQPQDETLMIGRETVYSNDGHPDVVDIHWVFPDYNPEWVSIDIRDTSAGGYFEIVGDVVHECAPAYALTVNSGSGSGTYAFDEHVPIGADASPSGYCFEGWVGDTAYVTDTNAAFTWIVMPAQNVEVTAKYNPFPDAGDLDCNGFVGQGDLDIVLDQWGKSGPEITDPRADPSADGFVGMADLDIVLDNWGEGCQ